MSAYFPTMIWDSDSGNRDSDVNTKVAPDWRDWRQIVYEVAAVQDYVLNHDIELGTRYIYFGLTPEASLSYDSGIIELNLAESGTNDFRIGDSTNYVQIDSTGVMTLAGTAERKMTIRPTLDYISQIAHSKPTQVVVGIFKGYSFPTYAANEELFYNVRVPYRWNGTSDIQICFEVALANVEDIGDTFKFQLSWEHFHSDDVIVATSNDVEIQQAVLSGHTAQYSVYHLHFTIDYDIDGPGNEVHADCNLGFRLRRIASSGTQVSNEIIVIDSVVDFQVDKLYGTWTRA